MNFYEDIAPQYDDIVDAAARGDAAGRFAAALVARWGIGSALDVACGTGLYARALAKTGVSVIAADISRAMLDQARAHDADSRIEWVHAAMQEIAGRVTGPFDAVLCMGNSIPHLLGDDELRATAEAFAAVAGAGGIVIIQLLNYPQILARRERIVGISRRGDSQYVRFYDFPDPLVRFNILELRWQGSVCEHKLHQTMLRPYTPDELTAALTRAGLRDIELFSGLDLEGPYDPHGDQVVLLAHAGPSP